jgi:1,4-dihydroxy-2-naphthoyl-CoA hydrolase
VTETKGPTKHQLEHCSEFVTLSGLRFDLISATSVTGWIDLGPQHHQPFGIVHGGVYASAIETSASVGASTAAMERDMIAVGVNNNTNFVASMSEGRVRVVAEAFVQGRTQQIWNVTITRESDDRLIASGQVRLQNVERR